MICQPYDPWNRRSTLLTIEECFHFIPASTRCDCSEAKHYTQKCPWAGYGHRDIEHVYAND